MSTVWHFYLMPLDRELAYECLKWIDPKVYKMYLNLRYRGTTPEQVEKAPQSIYKLKMLTLLDDTLESARYVDLLKLLSGLCTAYDIKKELDYPYASVTLFLDRYLKSGIVMIVEKEPARTGLYKKYYQLADCAPSIASTC
jgi:hypothetical protein